MATSIFADAIVDMSTRRGEYFDLLFIVSMRCPCHMFMMKTAINIRLYTPKAVHLANRRHRPLGGRDKSENMSPCEICEAGSLLSV